MKEIQTWHERAMAHPDHQSGMVSEDMIRARMCEEISDLRAEVARLHQAHQAACEGGDLLREEIERLTRERNEARAAISTLEIVGKAADDERAQLRAEVERLRAQIVCLEATGAEASDEIDRLRAALEAKP